MLVEIYNIAPFYNTVNSLTSLTRSNQIIFLFSQNKFIPSQGSNSECLLLKPMAYQCTTWTLFIILKKSLREEIEISQKISLPNNILHADIFWLPKAICFFILVSILYPLQPKLWIEFNSSNVFLEKYRGHIYSGCKHNNCRLFHC